MKRSAAARTRSGQYRRVRVPSRRQSPPNAMPAAIPAATPLTSMGVAHEWLAREPAPQFGKRLVVDGRQIRGLERGQAAPLDARLERADDRRVELRALVLVQLFHRLVVTGRATVDAVGG